jgi:hypothetical protein
MNTTTLTKLLAFLGAAMYFGAGPGLADKGECRHVGGSSRWGGLSILCETHQCSRKGAT